MKISCIFILLLTIFSMGACKDYDSSFNTEDGGFSLRITNKKHSSEKPKNNFQNIEISLYDAILENNANFVKQAIQNGENVNGTDPRGNPYLSVACLNELPEIVKILIENGADVNAKNVLGFTPLSFANDPESAKLLINAGANVNAKESSDGGTPLMHVKNPEVIKLLKEAGATINPNYSLTALVDAINFGGIKEMLDAGADINAKNANGHTALFWSVVRDDFSMVKFLIENGADVNIGDDKGYTPLMLASSY